MSSFSPLIGRMNVGAKHEEGNVLYCSCRLDFWFMQLLISLIDIPAWKLTWSDGSWITFPTQTVQMFPVTRVQSVWLFWDQLLGSNLQIIPRTRLKAPLCSTQTHASRSKTGLSPGTCHVISSYRPLHQSERCIWTHCSCKSCDTSLHLHTYNRLNIFSVCLQTPTVQTCMCSWPVR